MAASIWSLRPLVPGSGNPRMAIGILHATTDASDLLVAWAWALAMVPCVNGRDCIRSRTRDGRAKSARAFRQWVHFELLQVKQLIPSSFALLVASNNSPIWQIFQRCLLFKNNCFLIQNKMKSSKGTRWEKKKIAVCLPIVFRAAELRQQIATSFLKKKVLGLNVIINHDCNNLQLDYYLPYHQQRRSKWWICGLVPWSVEARRCLGAHCGGKQLTLIPKHQLE